MPYKDLHDKPFDEGTLEKLEIFEKYAQLWIPTWVQLKVAKICIYDFFAGTGYDKKGIAGSPIRLLQKLNEQIEGINQFKVEVIVHFNEFRRDKYDLLQESCNHFLNSNTKLKDTIKVIYHNEDFANLFSNLKKEISTYPSLVYLDQNGIRFLSKEYFIPLVQMKTTDFLYFASSSHIRRLGGREEFKKHLDIDYDAIRHGKHQYAHRLLTEQLRKQVPENSQVRLYPFSIKKESAIYGLIFGATSLRAVDKFLSLVWSLYQTNGEANFDIDDDATANQLSMFEPKRLTKIQKFQETLIQLVVSGEIVNNMEALNFCYECGHIGRHASDSLKNLKEKKLIEILGSTSPCVNYEKVYKEKKIVVYKSRRK